MNDTPAPAPTRTERRSARLNDPRLDWARSTTARRRLVVAMSAMIALEGVLLALSGLLGGRVLAVVGAAVVVLLIIAFVLCLGALKASTRGVEELGPDQLDERQMQVRGVIYAQAYKIGSGLLLLLLAAVGVWGVLTDSSPPPTVVVALLLVSPEGLFVEREEYACRLVGA